MTIVIEVEDGPLLWSLQDLLTASPLELPFVEQCVELGLAEVTGGQSEWRFGTEVRLRLLKAWRLHSDLELHLSALPLVLELLEELQTLRDETESLRRRLQHWEGGGQ